MNLDWEKAYGHLTFYIQEYREIGLSGILALRLTLLPLQKRYEAGERTQELWDEMMEVQ